jgi:DNA-binding response OmpR family regulator
MQTIDDTILVVDDDRYIQQALEDRLNSLGYRVVLASDGKQALDILDHQDPQIALLDIELPGIKGLDVLKEIRNSLRLHRPRGPGDEGRSFRLHTEAF